MCSQLYRLQRCLLLDLFKALPLDLDPLGHSEHREKIKTDGTFNLDILARHPRQTDKGIGQTAGAHQIGFRDAELGKTGLQGAIVEQSNAHGSIGGQGRREQTAGFARGQARTRGIVNPRKRLGGECGDLIQAAVGRKLGAAS